MSWNVCEFVESELVERFGYEETENRGRLFRRIDDQHGIRLSISGFERDDGESATLGAALARRDINELRAELDRKQPNTFDTTFSELGSRPFLDRSTGTWMAHAASTDWIGAYLDQWIPQLDGIANLSYIREYWDYKDPEWDEAKRQKVADRWLAAKILDRMLSGWNPAVDGPLLDRKIELVSHFPVDSARRAQVEAHAETIREWIAKHPDGIDRELVA